VGRRTNIKIKGKIVEGLGEGGKFTRIPWVRNQLMSKLSIDPFPGTLNLEISGRDDLENLETLRLMHGIEIIPEDPSFCRGKCYLALMGGRLRGAVVVPDVPDYPNNKIELISGENVKETLSINAGDFLEIEILPENQKVRHQDPELE
jgi:CTP-dependent riboflavin kinase